MPTGTDVDTYNQWAERNKFQVIQLILQDSSNMVNIRNILVLTSVYLLGNIMFSKDMLDSDSRTSEEFNNVI